MNFLEVLKKWMEAVTAAAAAGGMTEEQAITKMRELVTGAGMTMRSATEDATFLQNNSQRAIDEAFKNRNQQLEDTIKTVSGKPKKDASEKYYDYFQRVMSELHDELKAGQDKLKEIEKGGGDNVLLTEKNNQIKALQDQLQTAKKEHEAKLNEITSTMFSQRYDANMAQVIESIKKDLRDDIDPTLLEDIIANRINKFKNEFDAAEVEGQLIFKDKKTGTPKLNKQDGKHNNLSELLTDVFKDLKKPAAGGGAAGGAGSGKPGAGAAGDGGAGAGKPQAWKEAKRPDTVKNKIQLTDWLKGELKLDESSKDFSEAFSMHQVGSDGKELPLRN